MESSQVLKGLMSMIDIWHKLGVFFGRVLATTIVLCSWTVIIAFTLKVLWFIWFRILL